MPLPTFCLISICRRQEIFFELRRGGSRSRSCRHPRRRRHALRRRATKDHKHYFVLVDHWEHSYNFGSGDPRFHETPYSHTETLSWTSRVVLPEYFKYPNAVVAPSARDGMMAPSLTGRSGASMHEVAKLMSMFSFRRSINYGGRDAVVCRGWSES
jgi:hypothetical protein